MLHSIVHMYSVYASLIFTFNFSSLESRLQYIAQEALDTTILSSPMSFTYLVKDKGRGNPQGSGVRVLEGKGRGLDFQTRNTSGVSEGIGYKCEYI